MKISASHPSHEPCQVTITTAVHIPMQTGYWQNSFSVLRLFFDSLFASTSLPFDLMVLDNNSCPEVRDFLHGMRSEGRIQYLLESQFNLRKLGAMQFLFSIAPGEYIAFTDSDVYFLPGWLESSLAVMNAFPLAGQVTALPTIDKSHSFVGNTMKGIHAQGDIAVEEGQDLIPMQFINAHRLSIGRSQEEYLKLASPRRDVRITRGGISAFVSAQDFQFLTRRAVIEKVLPLELNDQSEMYDQVYSPIFEKKLEANGWWRLSTTDYLVHHMGNELPDMAEELKEIAPGLDIPGGSLSVKTHRASSLWGRLMEIHRVRKWLKKIYTWSYNALFENNK